MKKIVSLALAVLMLVSVVPMVHAATGICEICGQEDSRVSDCTGYCGKVICDECSLCVDEGQGLSMCFDCYEVYQVDGNLGSGTDVTYVGAGTEAYTVNVPAELAPGDEGTVTLTGTWASNRIVTVTADSTVDLVNDISYGDELETLAITFTPIEQRGNNFKGQSFTSTVSVSEMEGVLFGTWTGHFNYDIDFTDYVEMIIFAINGEKFSAERGMSWEEWLESEYTDDTDGQKVLTNADNKMVYVNENNDYKIFLYDGKSVDASCEIVAGYNYYFSN